MTLNRRRFVKTTVTTGIVAVAGCTSEPSNKDATPGTSTPADNPGTTTTTNNASNGTRSPMNLGKSVTYGGLRMSVTKTRTASKYTDDRGTHKPEQGAVFLLAYVRVENVGDTEIFYPERGGDIQLLYKSEEASDEFPTQPFKIHGETLTLYSDSMEKKDAGTGAFPGTVVEGWCVFEVPEGFKKTDTVVEIRYSDTSHDSREFRWVLAE